MSMGGGGKNYSGSMGREAGKPFCDPATSGGDSREYLGETLSPGLSWFTRRRLKAEQ